MSALGQKQTCAAQKVMSALPPKADMCAALADVRFVPIADIPASQRGARLPVDIYRAGKGAHHGFYRFAKINGGVTALH